MANRTLRNYIWKDICGIDEAGRGALAGPLVASGVILTCPMTQISKCLNFKIKDGKLLSPIQREIVYDTLCFFKTQIYLEYISVDQINRHGIGWANIEIVRRLIKKTNASSYIVDGNMKIRKIQGKYKNIISIVDADAHIGPVIFAGIVAKIIRDKIMIRLHKQFPQFEWHKNKGYGTKNHILNLSKLNPTKQHRLAFVATALKNANSLTN